MRCHRCHGLMNYETFYSHEGSYTGWRCFLCGEVVDELVLENRKRMKPVKKKK